MLNSIEKDLQPTGGDLIHATARIALSMIPYAGSAAAEIFNMVIAPPLERRRDQWMVRIYEGLQELKQMDPAFDIAELANNDQFITVVMQATQLAIKNHEQEKLQALHNAVLNAAVKISIDEAKQLMFLNYINDFTIWDIKLLMYLQDPKRRFQEAGKPLPPIEMGSPIIPMEAFYPEIKGQKDFIKLLISEMYRKGLLNTENLSSMVSKDSLYSSKTTALGKEFVIYISSPHL